MTNTSFSSQATSVLGAVAMTATCLFVATSPARADTGYKVAVEQSIARVMPSGVPGRGVATLAVTIDGNGEVAKVAIVRSAGSRALDAAAVRTAETVRYPAGRARTIAMVLGFGRAATAADVRTGRVLVAALNSDPREMLASR